MWRLAGSVFATSAPFAGGVTGSSPPERIRTGTSLFTGVVASVGATPFGHAAHTASARSASVFVRSGASVRAASAADTRGDVLGAGHRVVQRRVRLLVEIAGHEHRAGVERAEIAGGGAADHLRQQRRELRRVGERLQRADHVLERHAHRLRLAGARIGRASTSRPVGSQPVANRVERRRQIGMGRRARRRLRARVEDRGERDFARRPDVERGSHRRRRDAVEHDAAHVVRVPAQIFLRGARAVRAAPEVDLVVAQRRAHRVEIGDPRRRRVLRGVDALRGELLRAGGRLRHRIELERRLEAVVGLERRADERRRAAGAALVDEHDVAILAHAGQRRGERSEEARRLAGAAGENEQRIGARVQRVRRQHRDRQG